MPGRTAALDPGLDHPAVAIFSPAGVLEYAARVRVPGKLAKLCTAERCRQIAHLVADPVIAACADCPITMFVYELPQIYTAIKSKGDPNNLMKLGPLCGAVSALLDCACQEYLPGEWSHKTKKITRGDPWASQRGHRVRGRLTDEEAATVQATHDAVDAVGIGLHHLGRFDRVRVFSYE